MVRPKGLKHSEETKLKISNSLTGRKLSEDHILKMSARLKGHPFWGKKNYKMSEEAKNNIKEGIKEKRYTESYARKLSEKQTGSLNTQAKLTEIQVLSIRRLYKTKKWSQQALADRYNVSRSTIADIVNFRTWTHIS